MWPHSVTSLKTRSVLGIFWLSHTRWHVISLENPPPSHKIRRVHVARERYRERERRTALLSGEKNVLMRKRFFSACPSSANTGLRQVQARPSAHAPPPTYSSARGVDLRLVCHVGHENWERFVFNSAVKLNGQSRASVQSDQSKASATVYSPGQKVLEVNFMS